MKFKNNSVINQNNNEISSFNKQFFYNYEASPLKDSSFGEKYNPYIHDPNNEMKIKVQDLNTTKALQKNTYLEKFPNSKENKFIKPSSPSRIETEIKYFESKEDCNINDGFGSIHCNNYSNDDNHHLKSELNHQNTCEEKLYKEFDAMKNNMNYFDRKQIAKNISIQKNNEDIKNINYNKKESDYNNKNFYFKEEHINNAYQIRRNQKIDYEDFSNSIYNVNRKRKNNKINSNKNKEEELFDESVESYNIYANKKMKKKGNFNNQPDFENESFSLASEQINNNRLNNKCHNRNSIKNQSQLHGNLDDEDANDIKFNETLKNRSRATSYLEKKNKVKNNLTNNKAGESEEINNKFSVRQKFVPPKKKDDNFEKTAGDNSKYEELDKKLKGCDPKLIELIESEILSASPDVKWDDIAGLEFAKKTIKEIIIWPMLRPDIFKGIRKPPKGLLLFGPPGTGKTMIAKAIASESKSSFFNISASSLMSKWIGESERLVRTLFALASFHQPSVVFIDEIDSILTSRSENENESSRRIKTEFLVQLDGAGTNQEDRILIIGATNRPQEIDDAFIRRLSKRLYIPLPNKASRKQLIDSVIKKESEKNNKYSITESDLNEILKITKGYSGSDLMGVCREAAMMPIRSIEDILQVSLEHIRDICLNDFYIAVDLVKPSVSEKSIGQYVQWNKDFGSFNFEDKDE